MTVTPEIVPGSVQTDDNFHVWFVPKADATNPLSVATLTAATTKSLTYSLTPDGWNHTTTEENVPDERLTLKQVLQLAGRITDTLDVKYVYGATDDVARIALAEGTEGWIVARYAVPNDEDPAVGQVVDVIEIACGVQRKDAPTANSTFTMSQSLRVRGAVKRDAALVA